MGSGEPEVVPITADMAVDETLGGYDLLRRLGAGGMAEVHLARHSAIEGFQKLVVLKQILPHLARDRHFVRMFIEEARLAALLDHPNIVQVFDLGQEGDDFYFTMEFVYGENLQSVLRAIRKSGMVFPIEHAVTIAQGAAAGLQYAHERVGFDGRPLGIVHRDVSPTNVMITYEGGVKVADFGIAKVITRTDVTRAGTRKGKVPYMSPEQCRAEQIDRRSDVFSLGIVVYEMLTGKRLFDGDNEFGVMNTIVNGGIAPPSTVRQNIPRELDRIVLRALERDKGRRYKTAREMQLDLERFAREQKLRATPSALGELMHHLFRPQPFPWGALMGDGGSGALHLHTVAESSHPSHVGQPQSGTGASIDMTPISHVVSPQTHGSHSARGMVVTGQTGGSNPLLKGVAIGLGVVSVAAATLVLGLWLGARGKVEESESSAKSEAAAADTPGTPGADTPAAAAGDEPAPDSALPPPPQPNPAGTDPASADAPPPTEAAAADAPAPTEPEAAGAADAAPTEAEAAPSEPAPDEAPELEETVVIDESSPRPKSTRRKSSPKSSSKPKPSSKPKSTGGKKKDLDSFMPGM